MSTVLLDMSSTFGTSSSVSIVEGEHTEQRKNIGKRSLVWEQFVYDEDAAKSICQVEECGKSVSGKNPTNLKQHLKTFHKTVFQQLCKKEEKAKVKKEEAEAKNKA